MPSPVITSWTFLINNPPQTEPLPTQTLRRRLKSVGVEPCVTCVRRRECARSGHECSRFKAYVRGEIYARNQKFKAARSRSHDD